LENGFDKFMKRYPVILLFPLALLLSGCGYALGPQRLQGVSSVHVPVFESASFRRNLDYMLTEAVQREIRLRGAYRLDDAETADTILKGRIVEIRKSQLSETRFDDSRELQLTVGAEISWIDRRTGRVLQQKSFPLGNDLTPQISSVSFAPEVGHSLASAQQDAARRLAASIVDLMDMPW
jgi:outer membrane lipopolysaccharide assembly protein LptE/RlpB